MNEKFLKENNLFDAQKRFTKLFEYSFNTQLVEDDEDMGDIPNGDPNSMPQDTTNQQGDMQDTAPMSELPQDGEASAEDPMVDQGMEFDEVEMDAPEEDVEEIDVTELTDNQVNMQNDISSLDNKFSSLITHVEKLTSKIDDIISKTDKTEEELAHINQEIVKRNPTETEKLNIRSMDSYPFNIKPNEYWETKAKENPNYDVYSNNEVNPSDEVEYTLTQDEIDNEPINYNDLVSSFNDDENEFSDSLSKIFGY